MNKTLTIYNFTRENESDDWVVIDDVVMGGRSNGKFKLDTNGNGVFYGHVSLENNGGFSSVRHRLKLLDTENYGSFEIRLKGDGKAYQFRCKATLDERHSYIFRIETTGKWQTVSVPFKDMYAAFRGTALDIPNYPGKTLMEIAFLIGNKKQQDFNLTVDYIILK